METKRQYTEKEKQILLDLASKCAWSDPTKKPTKKQSLWRPTNLMLVVLLIIDGLAVWLLPYDHFKGIILIYLLFTTLILWGFVKRK